MSLMAERPILGITEEMVGLTQDRVEPLSEDLVSYVRGVSMRMSRQQPELHGYLKIAGMESGVSDALAFALGSSLTYEMIPQTQIDVPLSTTQVQVIHRTLLEHSGTEDEDGKQKAVLELSWFIDKLRSDSPSYVGWLGEMVYGIDDESAKKDFILGAVLASMPFYMRAEAQEMERTLFQD